MTVLAIDPGSEQSAWVLWDGSTVHGHGKVPNADMVYGFDSVVPKPDAIVFEQVASYGMAVGAEVFATVWWAGRMFQQALTDTPIHCDCHQMFRRDVKLHLCGQARAKDSNIRQALIDRFGGKETAIGTKHSPGPLYGLKGDCWQALALGVTWWDLNTKNGAQ